MTTVDPGTAQAAKAARKALLDQRIQQAARRAAEGAAQPQSSTAAPQAAEQLDTTDRATPLAVAQRPLWWFAQLTPDQPLYNEIVHLTKTGPLDVEALEGALNDLIRRHEAWRTTFEAVDGEPVQIVHPSATVTIPLVDLSDLEPAAAKAAALGHAIELARPAYDLAAGPLLRPLLVRLSPDEHRLYLAMHHLIFDGVSLYRVVLPELAALYDARVRGSAAELPAAPRYRDFVAWEQAELASPRFADHVEFHRRRLSGSTPMNLPLDRPRPARPGYHGALEPLRIPASVVAGLKTVADASAVTLFQVLAAAYAVLLSRFSGQEDVVFGTATDLRRRRDLVSVVGMCVSSAVLRVRLDDDPRFLDVVERLRDDLADVLDRHVPFDVLVRELQSGRDSRMHPLFQAGFVLEPPMLSTDDAWSLAQIEVELGDALRVAKFDLHLELDERLEGHLSGRFIFNTDLFDRTTAQRMVRAFTVLLESIVEDPGRLVSELPVLSGPELRELLVDWNDTAPEALHGPQVALARPTLTGMLEAQAAATPDAVAVSFEGTTLTYREFHECANALAGRLMQAGAGPGTLVGLGSERSIEMLVGLLAVLKAGAAYVPLDPALPPSRLRYMVRDAAPSVLLLDQGMADSMAVSMADSTTDSTADSAADSAGDPIAPGVAVVGLAGCLAAGSADVPAPARATDPEDPAYVIYTSGSTGRPKGVVVPHRAVANMLAAYREGPWFTAGTRILALATISFDIAAPEIWLPLTTGERCTLASRADAMDPGRLARLLRAERITLLQGTPGTLQALVDNGWAGEPHLTVFCGGEHLSQTLVDELRGRCTELWNMYGPTETTVFATSCRVVAGEPITIGRPIRGARVYLLDDRGRPVPVGVAGELTIGGEGVTSGYLNRPELTAERFVPEILHPGQRMYRTGDQARYLPDGRIEILGRLDHQVKIRGYRVELGEIENVVRETSGAHAVAVVLRELSPGDQRLAAYLVQEAGAGPAEPARLRSSLQALLPAYMIPSAFVTLPELPLLASGKVDRAALPSPQTQHLARARSSAVAQTPLERSLAQIWARYLGVDSVGPEDDFFELGGHSLLAVRLVAGIEKELGVALTISTLINGEATVRGLAARLEVAAPVGGDRTLRAGSRAPEIVRLNPDGDLAPLIMFFPSGGSLLAMRHLRSSFDERQPVIGLLAGLDDLARFPRHASVGTIARDALAAVHELQPPGAPFRIAGYSVAGLIAYETAGLLLAGGDDVQWLGLIDTYSPVQATRELSVALYLERSRQRNLRASLGSAAARIRTESIVVGSDLAARIRRRPLDRFDELGARRLISGYTPAGHEVPLHLLLTRESAEKGAPMLGWADLHPGRVVVHHVEGDHMSIMQGDAAARLGRTLAEALGADA